MDSSGARFGRGLRGATHAPAIGREARGGPTPRLPSATASRLPMGRAPSAPPVGQAEGGALPRRRLMSRTARSA